jgi:hypothetical protein
MMDGVVAVVLTWRGWMLVAGLVLLAVVAVLWLFARRAPRR